MNILMLLFKDIHYDARVQREALALAEAGHSVFIACVQEYQEDPPHFHNNISIIRVSLLTKSIKRNLSTANNKHQKPSALKQMAFKVVRNPFIKIVKDLGAYNEFYKKVKHYIDASNLKVDVIHCHDLNVLWQGSRLAEKCQAKLIYDSHELFNEMAGRNSVDRKFGYLMESKLIKRIDHLIVVNPYVEDEFMKMYGERPSTVVQNIPHLKDKAQLLKNESSNYWRDHYNLAESDVLLLYQGGLNPERGIEECIHALALLESQYKLILLGEGRQKQHLLSLVEKLNIQDRVFFHEQVPSDQILWYTKQADIGLVMYKNTSKNNYFSTPNKIFEYLLTGIPSVASKHPGKAYVIEKEKVGVCVEETPEAIKEGIIYISKNYEQFQEACLMKREFYSWDQEKQNLIEVYRTL
ncbi:glycosyltransferase [Alkalihalobacterium alkalinitrilicum]|uniref:glycosyltransferase n=1 Tax=Alkalihalobacterium alkalinitrilicum TaxID=427920 RepID=UPI000995B190|nr:glycosyltransferase [Alkalihalobacterium alkalinitrilicum]